MLVLETLRLSLIPCSAGMVQALLYKREEFEPLVMARLPLEYPSPEVAEFLPFLQQQIANHPEQAEWGLRFLRHRTESIIIGDAGFKGAPDFSGTVEIGYSILPQYRRQGYALEAVKALLEWATALPKVRQVVAECENDNLASIGVLEKAGLVRTGIIDNLIKWRLKVK
ncbi:MAG: GNAT family N-acetyltransferase [Chloroflexi bacterium]|uniref:GNAT family N-acetyltransferase n=1 Tax=Candidatus Chlorohelix allophototropha TaxID=3003348 RepID=A0A8T7M8E2_9CHLR|nr:GNAT family N-acetyltransferase [Chloroflexota bacterium]WJW68362.1 GNAT family N-acetyltransferase [Chloroflexota bacterium L227-S17]